MSARGDKIFEDAIRIVAHAMCDTEGQPCEHHFTEARKAITALLSSLLEQVDISGDWTMKPASEHTTGIPVYRIPSLEGNR